MNNILTILKDKRLVAIFIFGISSGFPWVMISSGLSAWLQDIGVSRTGIGFFGIIFIAYSINFLWAPFIDRLKVERFIPILSRKKAWIFICQLVITVACFGLSYLSPTNELYAVSVIALIIAVASATADIAIDSYRINLFSEQDNHKIPLAAVAATSGWWTGFAGFGSISFFLVDLPGWVWADTYQILAVLMLLIIINTFVSPKEQIGIIKKHIKNNSLLEQTIEAVVLPMRDFFQRYGIQLALQLLLFIFLFKIGEAFLGRMAIVFYKEIGFSNTDIGFYSKIISWWVTILFSILGGIITLRFGIIQGLFISGIAMATSNLLFALLAIVGPNSYWLLVTIIADGFTSAWSSVAFVSFLSILCHRSFSATQYALLVSLGALSRTLLASSSGLVVDWLDGQWEVFFIGTTIAVIPSLFLLWKIKDRIKGIVELNTK